MTATLGIQPEKTTTPEVMGVQPTYPKKDHGGFIGAEVWFWPPHPIKALTPAEVPFAGKVVGLNEDGTCHLALWNNRGVQSTRLNVAFSAKPMMSHWSWPKT